MSVFISYERADEGLARLISDDLVRLGVDTYLDIFDTSLGAAASTTKAILTGLRRCTHLLAVVSASTYRSWWVPFEIGAATESGKRICTFSSTTIALPEYLAVWPVITDRPALSVFSKLYLSDLAYLQETRAMAKASMTTIRSADDFHAALKRDLARFP